MLQQIAKLLNIRRTSPQTPGERTFFWFPRREAGKYIDHDSALTYSAVFAAVRVIAEGISSLPWLVLQDEADGSKKRLSGNPISLMLNRRANTEMGAFSWREMAIGHALLWGNHYSEIERDLSSRPVGLWPIHPGNVELKRDDNGRLVYEVRQPRDGVKRLAARDVFHLHGLGSDGLVGYSIVALAARSIGMGIAAEEFGASFYGNGAQLGGLISQKEGASVLDVQGVKNLLETFNQQHRGSANAHKVEYLDGGLSYQEIGVKPEDAQFLGSRQFSVTEIARWFRVPPHKIGDLERATFSNIEHQSIEFVTDTDLPWCVRLEQEANHKLFGGGAKTYTKLELKGLLRGDTATRTQFYKEMRGMGIYSANDILKLEDQNPIGPDGDARLVPLNMTTLERMVEGVSEAAEIEDEPRVELVAKLRHVERHQERHVDMIRSRYDRAEFFGWRDGYMARHFARFANDLDMPQEWLAECEHTTKRRLLSLYEQGPSVGLVESLGVLDNV